MSQDTAGFPGLTLDLFPFFFFAVAIQRRRKMNSRVEEKQFLRGTQCNFSCFSRAPFNKWVLEAEKTERKGTKGLEAQAAEALKRHGLLGPRLLGVSDCELNSQMG